MSEAPIVLLKVGETRAETIAERGDYEAWFQRALPGEALGLVDLRRGARGLEAGIGAAIIMGSPHSVYDPLEWYPQACRSVESLLARRVPLLGVCFGHQMLADVMGGRVRLSPAGFEGSTVALRLTGAGRSDALFEGIEAEFRANQAHTDSVDRKPCSARVLVENNHDRHQALAYGEGVWSTQFHPEIGREEMRWALHGHRGRFDRAGASFEESFERAADTPSGPALLARFVALARAGGHLDRR